MKVERMCGEDCFDISNLCAQLGYDSSVEQIRERFAKIKNNLGHRIFVVRDKNKVIGFAHVCVEFSIETGSFVRIAGLIVDEVCRGQGVGTMLLRAAEGWARSKGYESIRVNLPELTLGVSFYSNNFVVWPASSLPCFSMYFWIMS